MSKCPVFWLLILAIYSTADGQVSVASHSLSNFQKKSGPSWVKSKLIKSEVFSAPDFEFTDTFDGHRKFANIKGLFFKGPPFKGKQTKVFCWYGVPKGLSKGVKRPAVILVHGGGGTAFPEWVKEWTDRGYIAISVALEGQIPGERVMNSKDEKFWPTFEYSGPRRIGFFEDVVSEKLQDQWFYHAVADVMLCVSLLKSFPEVDTAKIGITGISWGGILANVITGIDNRFAFAIPVYGCGFLQETPHYSEMLGKLTKTQQAFYLDNWEPSLYVPLQKQPTLFVNGTNDFHFTMNSFTRTFEASPNEKYLCVEHRMKHGHQVGWAPKTIYAFADYVTNRGEAPRLPKFKSLNKKNELLYRSQGKVEQAFLYYTTDTADWGRDSYEWKQVTARLSDSGKTISASLPPKAVAYFINTIDSRESIYSSPMRFVKSDNPAVLEGSKKHRLD
ncbi:acetylxylan esterase [uncultured Kriegella sp.]|uniref:alpha/beta hydrolase family protein n=1 Tax=uncultured Kriegella sp. TaxID=1798910 RepID=UPI0030D8FB40|tara:strand:- start:291420 stop:292757 length:1338 start_codon:yes stop_codon:yes gene_type:complete